MEMVIIATLLRVNEKLKIDQIVFTLRQTQNIDMHLYAKSFIQIAYLFTFKIMKFPTENIFFFFFQYIVCRHCGIYRFIIRM